MKPREFWIAWEDKFNPDNPLGRIHNILRMVCNHEFKPSIHVREVVPIDWDGLWKKADLFARGENWKEVVQELVEKQLKGEDAK